MTFTKKTRSEKQEPVTERDEPEDLSNVELASLVPPKPEAPAGQVACSACGASVSVGAHESHREALERHYAGGHAS